MNQKQTAKIAEKILLKKNKGFRLLSNNEKITLATAFARKNMIIYGKAYDIIKTRRQIDFTNEKDIEANLETITVYEIKSTNRKDLKNNFHGYFFDLTTAELLVAQSLGNKFKFAFVNTITENFMELTINQVYSKAKRIYPKWAITFQ